MSDAGATLTFLGCGDAFGSGGRLHTCMHVATGAHRFLIDCGASALVGMRRAGVDPLDIDAVFISHFHADHFGGVSFLLIESTLRKRERPLVIVGPPGVAAYLDATLDAHFPGPRREWPFDLSLVEYEPGNPLQFAGVSVEAFPVVHTPETRPHGLRITTAGQILAYSGDTEWTDTLTDVAARAQLFVCEASTFDRRIPNHIDYATLRANRDRLPCDRLILTHMGPDTLAAAAEIERDGIAEMASDGLSIRLLPR